MTIYLYSGTPGTGKSLHAAHEIRWLLNRRDPRPVLGNFELAPMAPVRNPSAYHYYPNHEISPDLLTSFADDYWTNVNPRFREDYLALVLDECQ